MMHWEYYVEINGLELIKSLGIQTYFQFVTVSNVDVYS